MIPDHLVALDELPVTTNGKLDLEQLKARPVAAATSQTYVAPRTDLEKAFAKAWKETIGIEKVGVNDDFFELGGHSLHLFRIINQLHRIIGKDISIASFIQHPTIEKLLKYLETSASDASFTSYVQLEQEAVLDESITLNGLGRTGAEVRNIFLTGCTGFVGAYLLEELLAKQDCTIYCLVKAATVEQARARIRRSREYYALAPYEDGRVVPVLGDFSQPNFGLPPSRFDELCSIIDSVIHNGASTNLFYNYEALKTANVDGTKEVLRFACLKRLKSVNYVSTVSVFTNRDTELDEYSDIASQRHRYDSGYNATKWVAERLVLQARERGLPCNIYRLGRVMGHSETGIVKSDDYIYSALLIALSVNQLPRELTSFEVDIVPVDYVARAIVRLSSCHPEGGRVYHLFNPKGISIDDFILLLEQGLERKVERVDFDEWVENIRISYATAKPDEVPVFVKSLDLLPHDRPSSMFPSPGTVTAKPISCSITTAELDQYGIKCPEPDRTLIANYCKSLKKSLLNRDAGESYAPEIPGVQP